MLIFFGFACFAHQIVFFVGIVELLWGENKSRSFSLLCSRICKYLYSPPLDSWVRLHQSLGEDGWSKETLRSPSHWILWAIFLNMTANQTEICSGQSSKLAGQSKPNHPKHIYFCIHLPRDWIFLGHMCVKIISRSVGAAAPLVPCWNNPVGGGKMRLNRACLLFSPLSLKYNRLGDAA